MMSESGFQLRLRGVTAEDIAGATFLALAQAGWAIYHAQVFAARAMTGQFPPFEARLTAARAAFEQVLAPLPEKSPFFTELQRYVDEYVPTVLKQESSEGPKLKLVTTGPDRTDDAGE